MSTELDTLILTQTSKGELIARFWSNTVKIGKEKLTPTYLEKRKSLLESYWNAYLSSHYSILGKAEAANSDYVKNDCFSCVEEHYIDALSNISDCISDLQRSIFSESEIPRQMSVNSSLPKLELPIFSGNLLDWESFREQFQKLVHDSPELSNVHKLLYLKTHLRGPAADVIQNLPITGANYRGAWDDLERRYGSNRVLSNFHMKGLFDFPSMQKATPTELKRVLDQFRQTIRVFESLEKPVQAWDEWFVFLLVSKLDSSTRFQWELSHSDMRAVPSFLSLSEFLENRIRALDASREVWPSSSASNVEGRRGRINSVKPPNQSSKMLNAVSAKPSKRNSASCPLCAKGHFLSYCMGFKGLKPEERREEINRLSLCQNCLSRNHEASQCRSSGRCLACGSKHHTLLHEAFMSSRNNSQSSDSMPSATPSPSSPNSQGAVSCRANSSNRVVLLATFQANVESLAGKSMRVRGLIDTGSDTSFVTEWLAQALGLRGSNVNVPITGIQGQEVGTALSMVNMTIRSSFNSDFKLDIHALVLKRLTSLTPSNYAEMQNWPHLEGLTFADPFHAIPSKVDLILGADVCGQILSDEARVGPVGSPTARLTPFGWVLMGPVSPASHLRCQNNYATVMHVQSYDRVMDAMQKFWSLEEVSIAIPQSEEDTYCENHFKSTHSRDTSGRYIVRLPFKQDAFLELYPSRDSVMKLFLKNESRLMSQPSLRDKYIDFMTEYLSLGHMKISSANDHSYYLPHHAVLKENDKGKIRVVFNASFKSASGNSLNDLLLCGPRLQPDLWVILTRWRFFRVAFTSDIVKMFRQIRVHEDDLDFQRILWRKDPSADVKDYKLTTVTYGTAPAPFLAIRVLKQLVIDEGIPFPLGAEAIERHSYVDDILCGADNVVEAVNVKNQLTNLLSKGGFPLSKWASNNLSLCSDDGNPLKFFSDSDTVGTLGVKWSPVKDTFSARVATPSGRETAITKRTVLSEIARLFDPLGWMAPVLIAAKIIMQDLWLSKVEWDESLSPQLTERWQRFRSSLSELEKVSIPRWIGTSETNRSFVSLHGFCDASERAYAAVVYLRVAEEGKDVITNLLVSKTRIAPVKSISVPRLELCAAVLLVRLLVKTVYELQFGSVPVVCWTDSAVSLAWIRGHPTKWKTFVAHRVAEIQTSLPRAKWSYVSTKVNPADASTRGISPHELMQSTLWWNGPPLLARREAEWSCRIPESLGAEELEMRSTVNHSAISSNDSGDVVNRFSSFLCLLNVISLCLRWPHNFRGNGRKRSGFISPEERANALTAVIKGTQLKSFPDELEALQSGNHLKRSSPLLPLRPFYDRDGVLRVGGRLRNAVLAYDEKHPIIIPKDHHFTVLLVRHAHAATLHGGPLATAAYLAQRYWIIRSRVVVKREIRNCVTCTRFRGDTMVQRMGDLPEERVKPQRPFSSTGLDYAGPFLLRTTKGRGHKSYKGYICLFICMVTKAIHLECVSDLSTNAFLLAFRRFVSRRGVCCSLYSDNATTFRGAARELKDIFRQSSSFYEEVGCQLSSAGTQWTFIPPYAPHFGGLWEAAIKSTKFHLRRVIGDQILTFEEMSTLLCQIEACLNSRPLSPLSNCADDLTPLTPGHFLIGEPLVAIAEPRISGGNGMNLLNRFKLIGQMRDNFWDRWSKEYLHQLQNLPKWRKKSQNLTVGALVIIKDSLLPPSKWLMARVVQVFPGDDDLVRVVKLKTAKGIVLRSVNKICMLPC